MSFAPKAGEKEPWTRTDDKLESNPDAARFSGIPVGSTEFVVSLIMGVLAGIARKVGLNQKENDMKQTLGMRGRLAIVVALVILVAACGDDDAGTTTAGADTTTAAAACQLDIAFIGATSTQSFSIEQGLGAEAAGENYGGAEVTVAAPVDPQDTVTQIQLFNDALLGGADGIVLLPIDPDEFAQALADATEMGIPVIAADVPLEGYMTVVNDNLGMGSRVAEYLFRDVPSGYTGTTGTVIIGITEPGSPALELRVQGIKAWLADARPYLEVLGPFETTNDPTINTERWIDLVAAHPDAVAFMGVGEHDGPSLAGIRRASPGATWLSSGFEPSDTALEAIASGDLDAVGDPQHFVKGFLSVVILVEHLCRGGGLPLQLIGTFDNVVTADNVEGIITRQESEQGRFDWYAEQIAENMAHPIVIQP